MESGLSAVAVSAGTVTSAVRIRGLSKRYKQLEAVKGIDLDVSPGETFGFLGPNGAGKSTTINMLCTLTEPSGGTAEVAGFDVVKEREAVRRNIGLVFQDSTLDAYLTADENLRFHTDLYGLDRKATRGRLDEVLAMVGLSERRRDLVGTFSGGMRRRLEIARGLLHSPNVLFLDEPTIGLDPQTRASIWTYIEELHRRERITVFVTTHYMDEAENCDRIAIMNEGRIVALDTPDALKAAIGKDRVQITTENDELAIANLKANFDLDAAMHEDQVTISVAEGAQFVPLLFEKLGVHIRSVTVQRPSLDDVFLSYTGTTLRDAESMTAFTRRPMRRRR